VLKKLLLAVTAAATLASGAPVAHAAQVAADCSFHAATLPEIEPGYSGTYTGVLYGYAAFDDQDTHALRCWITVDGEVVASTPTASAQGFVASAGPIRYHADDGADVRTCTEVDGVASCEGTTTVYLPPSGDPDLLDFVWELLDTTYPTYGEIVDGVVCPVLASMSPGVPGVVDITPAGDVTLAGVGPFWDCPPYGDLFPPA
jgi:hypothetical protein